MGAVSTSLGSEPVGLEIHRHRYFQTEKACCSLPSFIRDPSGSSDKPAERNIWGI